MITEQQLLRKQGIESLLQETYVNLTALRLAKSKMAKHFAPDFRLFDFLRQDEMGLSKCIAALLEPNGPHGQQTAFLKSFLTRICKQPSWLEPEDLIHCKVILEKNAEGRRIDIYLDFPNKGVIGIENKPWAADQDAQLHDYGNFLINEAKIKKKEDNWLLIYLANHEPSNHSLSAKDAKRFGSNFQCISFFDLNNWLRFCLQQAEPMNVRFFIEELIKFITENVNGELEMTEQHEIIKTMERSDENFLAAFAIAENIGHLKNQLLQKLKADLLARLKGAVEYEYLDTSKGKKYIEIWTFTTPTLKNAGLEFSFAIEGQDFFWGVKNYTLMPVSVQQQKIIDDLDALFGNGEQTAWWPWYQYGLALPEVTADKLINWQNSAEPWIAIRNGQMAEAMAEIIEKIVTKLS